ncbi:hypothetical protein [Metamycoplasma hominis]|uniref:hypothetical protein n=1 Tax=Metamycoplasma hominis TaxID=2098 RepID=UPI001E3DF21E|nr:hypothetical protein [Metamycoplasma hominis]
MRQRKNWIGYIQCKLEPVEISGSLVSFATLNNFQYIKDLNLNENDLVYIKKPERLFLV